MSRSARKYARDARGRFASSGATARGARLKGKGAAGGRAQGRAGGNLDGMDVGRKSSGPKGTIGASKSARAKSFADRKGVSVDTARFKLNQAKAGRSGAASRTAKMAEAKKAERQKTFGSKAKTSTAKAEYKRRASEVRAASRKATNTKASMPDNKVLVSRSAKSAGAAKASLSRLVNSRGVGKKRRK